MVFGFHIFVPGNESPIAAKSGECVILSVESDVINCIDHTYSGCWLILISMALKAKILLRILPQILLRKIIILYRTPPLNTPNRKTLTIAKAGNSGGFES